MEMPKDKIQPFLLGLSLLTILCIGVVIQLQLTLNCDVSWLISAGEKMLQGGNYLNDFFSPNPPAPFFFTYLLFLFITLSPLSTSQCPLLFMCFPCRHFRLPFVIP